MVRSRTCFSLVWPLCMGVRVADCAAPLFSCEIWSFGHLSRRTARLLRSPSFAAAGRFSLLARESESHTAPMGSALPRRLLLFEIFSGLMNGRRAAGSEEWSRSRIACRGVRTLRSPKRRRNNALVLTAALATAFAS
eukprot:5817858-Pleurochrysis_carterae.AAC.1